jgi:pyruvate formate-lyase activating enzyme-like uncharacterized protein
MQWNGMAMKTLNIEGEHVEVDTVIEGHEFHQRIMDEYRSFAGGLDIADDGATVTNKCCHELSKGCQACKAGGWLCFVVGLKCNLSCDFCSRSPKERHHATSRSLAEIIELVNLPESGVTGVAYTGGEPFLYLEKIVSLAKGIASEDRYQWVYTNGLFVSEDNLRMLHDVGVSEVRVDLAATDFSMEVMGKIPMIHDIIGRVTVEVPAISRVFDRLTIFRGGTLMPSHTLEMMIQLGVDQVNLAEHFVRSSRAIDYLHGQEVYQTGFGSVSSTRSRKFTVDIMRMVVDEGVNILVNDCSNFSKSLQVDRRCIKGLAALTYL